MTLKVPDTRANAEYQTRIKKLSAEKYHYIYDAADKVPYSVTGFFDACRLYGLVLNETLKAEQDPLDGLAMTRKMWGRVFPGLGAEVVISENGDRVFDFYLLGFDPHIAAFTPVLDFTASTRKVSLVRDIFWANRQGPPPNTPPCGYDGKSGVCARAATTGVLSAGAIAAIVVGGALGLMVFMVLIARQRKKGCARDNENWWRIDWLNITALKDARSEYLSFHSSGSSLQRVTFAVGTAGAAPEIAIQAPSQDEMHSAPRLPSNSVGQLTALKIPSSHSSNTMPESKRVREAAASYVSRHTRTSNGARTLNSSMQATYIETGMYLDTQVAVKRVGKAVYLSRAILHDLRLVRATALSTIGNNWTPMHWRSL
ncbi:hypothetical protein RvY_04652-3 [Ramazzottius varieornatus]|uniref:Uncharacterized protein n=1 Tax=Ramazzottius varieornatus TaxID=947166 RepID=A0A1D1UY05_RAMVA|nr:hypothetical protein RvY_04652-3 [Ramazzottius varieornatus]